MQKTAALKQPVEFVYNWMGSIPFERSLSAQEELKALCRSNIQPYIDSHPRESGNLAEKTQNSLRSKIPKDDLSNGNLSKKNSLYSITSKDDLSSANENLYSSRMDRNVKKTQFYFLGFEVTKPVITLGLRSDESHILFNEEQLKQNKLSILSLKRGGEATLHAPGQLVIYPILHLPFLALKVKDFIVKLEEITQSVLKDFGIETKKDSGYAGLYTAKGKICFFGIHISGGVSQHGVSINVHNDLSLFSSIKSCGEKNRRHDSLSLYPSFSLSQKELFLKWCAKAHTFFSPQN